MKNKFYSITKLSALIISAAFMNFSQSALAQCTADAGQDVQSCVSGPITLAGSFTVETDPTPTLDINQNQINACMAGFAQSGIAQSFTVVSTNDFEYMCGAGLSFETAATGMLVISLYAGLNNGGPIGLLATGSTMVNNSTIGEVFWNSVQVWNGAMYFLVYETVAPQITACIAGSTNNPYSGGHLYANSGYQAFTTYDYTFSTYICNPSAEITWEGPNIEAGANTTTPTVNPPLGVHTYTMTVVDPATNCTATDEIVVTRGENVTNQITETAVDSYTWNGVTYTEGGQYTQTLTSSLGCDSTVTLILDLGYANIDNYASTFVKLT